MTMLYFSPIEKVASFVVLDAARVGARMDAVRTASPDVSSLYRGAPGESLDAVAPYVARCVPHSDFNRILFGEGWGNSWGIFLSTRVTFAAIQHHLRHFLIVEDPARRKLYFRFYDPRVLRVFLPSCSGTQLKQLFGPIDSFILEDEDPASALVFRLDRGELRKDVIDLTREIAAAPPAAPQAKRPSPGEENVIV